VHDEGGGGGGGDGSKVAKAGFGEEAVAEGAEGGEG
jgi:hypothetical protein